ncbi:MULTISPECIES: SpdD-like protein [unclassified Streptomyces]|uniref:SpdD-like protein n=1 Tax=unclassified Streptomyces TaxID=2593676 RepID=UPI003692F506
MFRPRIPVNPLPTGIVTPLVQPATVTDAEPMLRHHQGSGPVPAAPRVQAPAVRLTPTGLVTVVAGGAGLVLLVGTVLVSLLLAVAITGASVAVVAVVLRLLVRDMQKGR